LTEKVTKKALAIKVVDYALVVVFVPSTEFGIYDRNAVPISFGSVNHVWFSVLFPHLVG